jgi:radical SAM superfamily enzyme YgiQ (UPF0313 family)
MLTALQKMKFKILAEGVAISEYARTQLASRSSGDALTLADYASTSGIPICLPGNIWVNAPIIDHNPNFVSSTPHLLDWNGETFLLYSPPHKWPVEALPVPAYASENNSRGEPFPNYGLTHTDRVRVSPITGCVNGCEFCDLPRQFAYRRKDVELLIETIQAALNDPLLPAKHILISGGTPREEDYGYLRSVYDKVLEAFPNTLVDIMMLPLFSVIDLASLRAQGLNGLSVNLELYDDEWRRRLIPGKHAIQKDKWLSFIDKGVEIFGTEFRSMLIVGLEPLEQTLRGVKALAERGCTPVLSPFRPSPFTPLADFPAPGAEYLSKAYEHALEICSAYDVKLGPKCIPCHHNTLTFPDDSTFYRN